LVYCRAPSDLLNVFVANALQNTPTVKTPERRLPFLRVRTEVIPDPDVARQQHFHYRTHYDQPPAHNEALERLRVQ